MKTQFSDDKPIFLQLATMIEDSILKDIYVADEQIISTNELAITLKINPATAGKAINLLVDEQVLYKKRGIGMFVAINAKQIILNKRKKDFYDTYVAKLLVEAKKIGITTTEIIEMLNEEETNGNIRN